MTTVMKASGSAEFLGLVPALAGCTPTRSIALLPFEGRRTHGALRLDLPDDPAEFAGQAVSLVRRVERTDALALVVYCDEDAQATPDGLVLPHAVLAESVIEAAEDQRLGIVDALCVTPGGWARYLDDDPVLHPLAGIPPLPPDVEPVIGDQSAGAELPAVDLAARERVGRALADLDDVLRRIRTEPTAVGRRENPQAVAAAGLLEDLPELYERALHLPDDPPPFLCAALLWLLDRPLYRDAALVQWATDREGGARALDARTGFREDGRLPPLGAGRVLTGEGPRPDLPRLRHALRTVRMLAAIAPPAQRVGPLSLAAWLSWALGRSSHAAQHLAALHRIEPDHRFGRLLSALMGVRPIPDWAFRGRGEDAA